MLRLKDVRPEALVTAGEALAEIHLPTAGGLWATVQSRSPDVRLPVWLPRHRDRIEGLFEAFGAVLLRGFAALGADEFRDLVRDADGEPMDYRERSTPRTNLGGGLFTSTEYPADEVISLHSEFSYANRWPARLWFHCARPADRGGQTLLASTGAIHDAIAAPVRARFERRGVRYVRHYGLGIDLPWQEAFQTDDRAQVELYCHAEGVAFEWTTAGTLRTWQDRPAMLRHPRTRRMVWFNQAHLFHPSGLPAAVQRGLVLGSAGRSMPRTAQFGGGADFEAADLAEVRQALDACTVPVPWQAGDTLLLDNMSIAHGRACYAGPRRVLVMLTTAVQR